MSVTQQQIDDLTASMSTLQSSFDGLSGSMDAATFGEDVMWVLICGTLVFFMQAGFAMLEAGAVRSKNAVNILFKNLIDGAISAICFWILGYGFAYGNTKGGFIGVSLYALSGDEFDLNDTDQLNFQSFFFQWAFAATAATIVSGCVAERCKLEAYFIYSAVLAIWIYPVVVHWCWGQGWLSPFADQSYDYLFDGKESNNFIDFAGSGIVHATGGIAGCVAAIALGPRKGRFNPDGTVNPVPAHSVPMMLLGTIILWVGWYGFNPGSTLGVSGSLGSLAGKVAVTTTISAAASALTMVMYQAAIKTPYDIGGVINAILGGLVSITAPCAVVDPWAAFLIGIIGCFVYIGASKALLALQIDDPLDASPIHGACGIWGVLSVGIFGNDDNAAFAGYLGSSTGNHPFRTGEQFGVQLVGMLSIFAWVAGWSVMLFFGLKMAGILRVSEEVETAGLDSSEHGTPAYANGDIELTKTAAPADAPETAVEVEKGEYAAVSTGDVEVTPAV
mmetsp:Transcript_31004/g.52394  ORF Transcript_31004/g.52394 Transcript_31004/m.52394 type:complete len:504 (-) Transcript_31004:328-1839(-)|eukprot:CAMPEP_0174966690 /NCGR_PEP_ID=MMETSP0004_2-20121128/7166_1 /TAXON_ID=420556 /ORGANISM="Ochromonas sp., Strain CCMP1393" /LENGTH=503 /DNA_ID=CAMNT_0016215735 /DNA_START=61 /DNA_END=1572 /DNA_ORIENTATION=+